MKKKNLIVLLAAFGLLLVGCNNKKEEPKPEPQPGPVEPTVVHVDSVSLDKANATLEINGTVQLTATVLPATADDKSVSWTSSVPAVAEVSSSGLVTAKSAGQTVITVKTTDGNKTATCNITVNAAPVVIDHQDPFVGTVTNPSETRAFREEFDGMIEDFSGATPSGTTTGVYNKSFLRVLVDSADEHKPTSPDASIYKMATGAYPIENYEGIGFRMRKVGNGALNLSNLVLGLRGDDAWKVFPLKLSEALDPDGEALPELTAEFQDVVIAPGQSIEDANTVYELLNGTPSETKVLDKILGFHLYALNEECSAVVEIEEVFLVNAGEKTSLDTFAREKPSQTDPSCWWRDSTGFIVQKGVTLNNKSYTTKAIELGEYQNLVISVLGDTSGLKINNVAYSALKDNNNAALTGAVNGAFYSYVINLTNSGLALSEGKFVIESTTEVVISKLFLTNLVNEVPLTEYPKIDLAGGSYISKFDFTMAKGSIKASYEEAVADQRVIDAGLNYVISYTGASEIAIDGNDLVFSGGTYDFANLVIGSNAVVKDYLVIAVKSGANLSEFRIKLGQSEILYANQWLAGAGLPSVPENHASYPYVKGDYELLVIDLARSGFASVNNEIQMWYTGAEDLAIGAILFADAYKADAIISGELLNNFDVAAGSGYGYVGASNVEGLKYVKIETTAVAANDLRFGTGGGIVYLASGNLIDADGKNVPATATTFTIDLQASGIELGDGAWFHIHSTLGEAFNIKVNSYIVTPQIEVTENELYNQTVAAGSGYGYVTALDVTGIRYLHITTTAAAANELRFGLGGDAIYLNTGNLIDKDGNNIPATALDFILDIEASGIVLGDGAWFHIHSTLGDAFTIRVASYAESPLMIVAPVSAELPFNVEAGSGYGYVGALDVTGASAVKVTTTAAAANELRFGLGGDAIYLNTGNLVDVHGDKIPATATEFIIDLAASGIVLGDGAWFHIHSTLGDAFTITVQAVNCYEAGSYAHLLAGYNG